MKWAQDVKDMEAEKIRYGGSKRCGGCWYGENIGYGDRENEGSIK